MNKFPARLAKKLEHKKEHGAFRSLGTNKGSVDFCSNDYLGFAGSQKVYERAQKLLAGSTLKNGATGSRLLSGNHELYSRAEDIIRKFHKAEASLIFNSGYDANVGFFSAVPGREDVVFYDEFIHASIRDGISMSHSKAFKFRHNDLEDLEQKIEKHQKEHFRGDIFIVTESVFSMDGDSPDLEALVALAETKKYFLIIDEAHAVGVFGEKGEGLVQKLGLEQQVFTRIVTFGKALGTHGAAIFGSSDLKDYLINFSRSFIYTTALPPHSVASIIAAYENLADSSGVSEIQKLRDNISFFRSEVRRQSLAERFIESKSAIQIALVQGNEKARSAAKELQAAGFDVKPILSPTVPEGKECLRFCLHSFNTKPQISDVTKLLSGLL